MSGAGDPVYDTTPCDNIYQAVPASNTSLLVKMDPSALTGGGCEATGTLASRAQCSYVSTAPRYGTSSPGNSGGWTQSLSGSSSSVALAADTDAICYIVSWEKQENQLYADPDHVWISDDSGTWTLHKNHDYITAEATCLPYDQHS